MRIQLFNTFSVTIDKTPVHFRSDKIRALLAYLAVEANRPHRRASLAALLWGELPQKAALSNLRVSLSRLRNTLVAAGIDGDMLFTTNRQTVQLNLDADWHWLDTAVFDTLWQQCVGAYPVAEWGANSDCVAALTQAVTVAKGDFLAGLSIPDSVEFESWCLFQAESWHERHLTALDILTECHLQKGESKLAQKYARRQLVLESWRERAHRQLMHALAQEGRRQAALAQFETCRHILATELGVMPEAATVSLYDELKQATGQAEAISRPVAIARHNLPASATSLIGREAELRQVVDLLTSGNGRFGKLNASRLLTLVGLGGIGKTELALAAGRRLAKQMADGVLLVTLDGVDASVTTEAVLYQSILDALPQIGIELAAGAMPSKLRLQKTLVDKQILLLLDNFESVLDCAVQVADLLANLPQLSILVTSRRRLHLQGEMVLNLTGLSQAGAAALVACYGQQARLDFELNEENETAVFQICRLVGGMPLALQLAAAWLRLLSPAQIAAQIEQDLSFLATKRQDAPRRHQEIEAVLRQTWRFLSEDERQVLAALSLFHGSFSHEVMTKIAYETAIDPLDKLKVEATLVDNGVLSLHANGRLHLHPLVRRHAAKRLEDLPKLKAASETRFVHFYATFVQQHIPITLNQAEKAQVEAIVAEIDNVRAAWQLGIAHSDLAAMDKLLMGLRRFYIFKDWHKEGTAVFNTALSHFKTSLPDWDKNVGQLGLFKSKLLSAYAGCARFLGMNSEAEDALTESLAIARQLDDLPAKSLALAELIKILENGRLNERKALLQEYLTLSHHLEDTEGVGVAIHALAVHARLTGHYQDAEKRLLECEAICHMYKIQQGLGYVWLSLAHVYIDTGAYEKARFYLEESISIGKAVEVSQNVIPLALIGLIDVETAVNNYDAAQAHYQECCHLLLSVDFQIADCFALHSIGQAAHQQGDWQQAQLYLMKALQLLQTMDLPLFIADTMISLGNVLWQLGDHDEACDNWQQAAELAQEHGSTPLMLAALAGYSQQIIAQGDVNTAISLLTWITAHPKTRYQERESVELFHVPLRNGMLTPHSLQKKITETMFAPIQ